MLLSGFPDFPDFADEVGSDFEGRFTGLPFGRSGLGTLGFAHQLIGLNLPNRLGEIASHRGVMISMAWMTPSGSMMNRPRTLTPAASS